MKISSDKLTYATYFILKNQCNIDTTCDSVLHIAAIFLSICTITQCTICTMYTTCHSVLHIAAIFLSICTIIQCTICTMYTTCDSVLHIAATFLSICMIIMISHWTHGSNLCFPEQTKINNTNVFICYKIY